MLIGSHVILTDLFVRGAENFIFNLEQGNVTYAYISNRCLFLGQSKQSNWRSIELIELQTICKCPQGR